jgi:hypothetical protein
MAWVEMMDSPVLEMDVTTWKLQIARYIYSASVDDNEISLDYFDKAIHEPDCEFI